MMVLGLPPIKGLDSLKGFDLGTLATGVGRITLAILIFAFMAIVIGVFLWRKSRKQKYDKKIFWFEEVGGNIIPVGEDNARELTIPNTNVNVFYIKKKDLYLPRGTKRMGKDAYWYCIRNNREIVNFAMSNLNEDMKKAKLDFDHTDMRYAKENLLALIKRNYRDNSKPWWREYKDVIATVIFIFVMSLAFFFLLTKIGKLIGTLDSLIENAEALVKAAGTMRTGSGVTT